MYLMAQNPDTGEFQNPVNEKIRPALHYPCPVADMLTKIQSTQQNSQSAEP